MKDWGLAGEKPSFIVVLSTFPHQHENHLRWPSFPASFDFICSSILVIWPNQSHIKEVAGIWKHLYGNSKMFRDIFNSLYIGFQKTFFHPILGMGGGGGLPTSVTTDWGYIREVSAVSEPLQSLPPTTYLLVELTKSMQEQWLREVILHEKLMKDWGLAGVIPSFIVVLSIFPHKNEIQ